MAEKIDTYVVKKNDTLSDIAKKIGIDDWTIIGKLNGISSPKEAKRIKIGQELKLPTVNQTPKEMETPQPQPQSKEAPHSDNPHIGILFDKLTQNTVFTSKDIEAIQKSLIKIEIDPGKPDAIMGKDTCRGIIQFLKTEEGAPLISMLGQPARKALISHEYKTSLERLESHSEMDLVTLSTYKNGITNYLSSNTSNATDNIKLGINLNALGYTEEAKFNNTKSTSSALMEYMKDNPEVLFSTSVQKLKNIMDDGQYQDLKKLAQSTDGFDDRIIIQLMATNNMDTTTSSQQIYALKLLLDLRGYDSGKLNGFYDKDLDEALYRFRIDNNLSDEIPTTDFNNQFNGASSNTKTNEPTKPLPPAEAPKATEKQINNNSYNNTNGYGVSNTAIERAYARALGEEPIDQKGTTPQDNISDNPLPLIVIDLGHGSRVKVTNADGKTKTLLDSGKSSSFNDGLHETNFIDPVGMALAEKLHAIGYPVAFTRNPGELFRIEGTKDTLLKTRALYGDELCKELGANGKITFSIHANADSTGEATGTRIYVQKDKDNKALNSNSQLLAESVGQKYSLGKKPSEVITESFSVIRNSEKLTTPDDPISASALIELGFMNNRSDHARLVEMLKDPEATAARIAKGIDNYVVTMKPEIQIARESGMEDKTIEIAAMKHADNLYAYLH